MDDLKIFKEKQINNYIYTLDLSKVKANQIKNDLRKILDEEPAVKFNYKSIDKLNEKTGDHEKENKLETIEIYYTYIGSDNNQHASHMKYIVD